MNDQDMMEVKEQPNLKSILLRLREIKHLLEQPENKLDYLAHANERPIAEMNASMKQENNATATLAELDSETEQIAKLAHNISKHTSIITGN
jgi:hypothetical protein